jgi:hypothetical protein
MSDIIRMARQMYPDFDQLNQEAGQIKQQYVAEGGDPSEVYSPERVEALMHGGPEALIEEQAMERGDGSIAAPYVPTELALEQGMIEPGAVPAVLAGLMSGINTVSSGIGKDGRGFAVGRDQSGAVVRVSP